MSTSSELQLLSELPNLCRQNKQWFSDVLFLEDETRFFRVIFNKAFSSISDARFQEVRILNLALNRLEARRNELKCLIMQHQSLLDSVLKDRSNVNSLLEKNEAMINEIKELFVIDRLEKNELFENVQEIIWEEKECNLVEA